MAANRTIGKGGQLPWHLPEDLKFFRKLTTGHPIIMGRKTWESLGKPLPNRRNIILSRTLQVAPGAEIIREVHELAALSLSSPTYVIGGAEIYRLLLPGCVGIYLTVLHQEFSGDVFFPRFEEEFPVVSVLDSAPGVEWRLYRR